MRKLSILTLMTVAVLAFLSTPILAGSCSKATGKAATCSVTDKAACLTKFGITEEECMKLCKEYGPDSFTHISIKGMTCGGCESDITKMLETSAGVKKVIKVSHKDGLALVAVDNKEFCGKTVTTAISNKGYMAEIIPAVATMDDAKGTATKAAAKGVCSPTCAKTCTMKKSADTNETKKESKDSDGTY